MKVKNNKVLIEIKLKDDFFNKVSDIFNRHRYLILRRYNINLENNSYILTVKDIIDGNYTKYRNSDFDYLFNKQELFEKPIYIMITLTNVYYLVIGIYLIIQQGFI